MQKTGFQISNNDEIVTSVQKESDHADDETDEEEDNNNESSKGPSNAEAFSALETAIKWEPKDHSSDCYFCLTNIKGIASKSKHTVMYPDFQSAMRPVPRSKEITIPKPSGHVQLNEESSDSDRKENGLVFCNDISSLMKTFGIEHNPIE
ncbi:hypothetical protein TNCV_908791 [Trichonephila clavipes]|nr:hypothetical protein TNCV_908791 [Trichonephila clavipes]